MQFRKQTDQVAAFGKSYKKILLGVLAIVIVWHITLGCTFIECTGNLTIDEKPGLRQSSESVAAGGQQLAPLAPGQPESLDSVDFCSQYCKHVPGMCTEGKYGETLFPAPTCKKRSGAKKEDIYHLNPKLVAERDAKTKELIKWVAKDIRGGAAACESDIQWESPMMHAQEFEMLAKTLSRRRPKTYLEWGSGRSTSFYPLLSTGDVFVIDNYPPWCEKVLADPTVSCIAEKQNRLTYSCAAPVKPDGTPIVTGIEGRPTKDNSMEEIQMLADQYLGAIDKTHIKVFDAALIDGRLRGACALKVLNFIDENSVVFIHDFWSRLEAYGIVLEYYDVIGYARSLVIMKRKPLDKIPSDWQTVWKQAAVMKDVNSWA